MLFLDICVEKPICSEKYLDLALVSLISYISANVEIASFNENSSRSKLPIEASQAIETCFSEVPFCSLKLSESKVGAGKGYIDRMGSPKLAAKI